VAYDAPVVPAERFDIRSCPLTVIVRLMGAAIEGEIRRVRRHDPEASAEVISSTVREHMRGLSLDELGDFLSSFCASRDHGMPASEGHRGAVRIRVVDRVH
jgi:hypothetical protein